MIPPVKNSITASPISTSLSSVRGNVLKTLILASFMLATVHLAEAQQPAKIPQIGFLSGQSATQVADNTNAFRKGLGDLGYIEGKNIAIEYRWAEGKIERLPDLAAELVRRRVDVLVAAGGTPGIRAAKNATSTIPIVFAGLGTDPVELGFIASLARPGGNITGVGSGGPELYGKRLKLLKEAVLGLARVAYLRNPDNPASRLTQEEIRAAARALGLQIQTLEVRKANDLDAAFEAATRAQARGLIVAQTPPITSEVKRVVNLTAKSRLPAIYANKNWPDAGGLMSHSTDSTDVWRRAATYVDRILKGAKPADLPVEQPMKFEFVISLKTAKQIGLTIPPNVLARADKVIR
jgi:putative tryptophan/tyrosine transport system substrate-binding protein